MKKYYLSGIIHPERANISISEIEQTLWLKDGGKYGSLKFNIYNNQITATLEIENEMEDIPTIRNNVKSVIETAVNALGFLKGYAYDVEITKIFDENLGVTKIYGIEIPALEERNKEKDLSQVGRILDLCSGIDGLYLKRCLSDLSMAIKHAEDTPFYCYRALESLKQYFGEIFSINDDDKQWEKMAKELDCNETDTKEIREYAFPARHGVPKPIQDEQRKQFFLKTWEIVEKFIEYRKITLSDDSGQRS
jgi:hypothetical protein